MSVPLPAPDGPVMTKTGLPGKRESLRLGQGRHAVEQAQQLAPLPLREAADGLRLADPALVQEPRGLDPAELRDRHEDVEHLRRLDVLRRVAQHLLDLEAAVLQVLLQLGPPDADLVRALEGLHPLVERPDWGLRLGL